MRSVIQLIIVTWPLSAKFFHDYFKLFLTVDMLVAFMINDYLFLTFLFAHTTTASSQSIDVNARIIGCQFNEAIRYEKCHVLVFVALVAIDQAPTRYHTSINVVRR